MGNLNREQGRFLAPIRTVSGASGGNNVCGINPVNALLAFGGECGLLDIWDSRTVELAQKPCGTLDVAAALRQHEPYEGDDLQITSVQFDESDGVSLAVGCSTGYALLFDLRSPRPTLERDQGNGLPVHNIRLHEDGKHCVTADARSVKVWNRKNGMNMVAIEPDSDVNHVCVIGGSGVICTALETQRVKTYYKPAMGTAPKWCAFLDTFTEELEDGRDVRESSTLDGSDVEKVYENYKFVAHDQVEVVGLDHLIGTDLLKPYMHGYFVHQKLYRRAIEVSEPFAYERYRKEKAREKVEAERQNRITKVKTERAKKVEVNQAVVESLWAQRSGKKAERRRSVLEDERFKAMFSNKDYAVDEEAERFQFLNPSGLRHSGRAREEQEKEDESDSDEEYLEQFDLVEDGASQGGELWREDDEEEEAEEQEADEETIDSSKRRRGSARGPKMYEIGAVGEVSRHKGVSKRSKGSNSAGRKIRDQVSLGARVATHTTRRTKREVY
ncbi:nucleolar protein [Gracilaria domingensis]|nr:nucleolar protein [Gracilaria domingensis]